MQKQVYFHGTESVFDKFMNCRTFFADCGVIASVYGDQGRLQEDESFPNVHPCYLELGNTFEISENYMIENFGAPAERDWLSFDEFTYSIEAKGYNSVFLNNVVDYAGEELGLQPYNQYVVFKNSQIKSIFEI